MTYRERRLAKAERLREWADKRNAKIASVYKEREHYAGDTAFWTQPGNIPERTRLFAKMERAHESGEKAADMNYHASMIEDAADRAIYSDDPDAVEALTARIATLEAKRDARKAKNDEYRKAHRAELKLLTAYGRDQAVPFPGYSISNLTADIARNKKRLTELSTPRAPTWRLLEVRYGGECDVCVGPVERGAWALYCKAEKTLRHSECHK